MEKRLTNTDTSTCFEKESFLILAGVGGGNGSGGRKLKLLEIPLRKVQYVILKGQIAHFSLEKQ